MNEQSTNNKTSISKPIDTTKRKAVLYGFSISFALLIAFSLFIIYKIPYINSAPFIILVLVTFSISILNGIGIQTAICSKLNFKQIFTFEVSLLFKFNSSIKLALPT